MTSPAWPDIVCPTDRQSLRAERDRLSCPNGHVWNVELGIPRMIDPGVNYSDAFGIQWKRYRRTQLDSYTGTTISRDRARRCMGEAGWRGLHLPERTDVLEVGCGAGRFSEILLATGAFVTSVDFSSAVEANLENFPDRERHRILQADALHLPFPPARFDMVFCLGVIQHTPNPERTIESLYAQVRPGGTLVIDHYAYSFSYYTKTAPLFRMVLRRLPPDQGLKWTDWLVERLFPVHRAVGQHRAAHALLSRVSPVLTYFRSLPLTDELQREWSYLDTHDFLTDWHKHFRTRGQIRRVLENLGAEEIWCGRGGNGIEARCRRPEAARPVSTGTGL